MRTFRRKPAAGTALFFLFAVLASGDIGRDLLGVRITAQHKVLSLEWDKRHPWAAQLQGGRVALLAEYRTSNRGVVTEALLSTGTTGDGRSLRFALPNRITGVPLGSVCLLFQLPNRRVLPIRKAADGRSDTSRFSYVEWESEVVRLAREAALQAEIDRIRRELTFRTEERKSQESVMRNSGWTTSTCSDTKPQTANSSEPRRPFDVLDPAQHGEAARLVCTMRVANAFEAARATATKAVQAGKVKPEDTRVVTLRLAILSGEVQPPGVSDTILELAKLELSSLPERAAQMDQFRRDYDHHAPKLSDYRARMPAPFFGTFGDTISLQSSATEAIQRFLKAETSERRDVFGYIGSTLEAYSRCVADGIRQLATKYEIWSRNQARAPVLDAMKQRDLRDACEGAQRKLQEIDAQIASLNVRLADKERERSTTGMQAPLAVSPKILNHAVCDAQAEIVPVYQNTSMKD